MTLAHLVTGGTGFVGSALILELLQHTDVQIVALVRGDNPQTRLRSTLQAAAEAYKSPAELLTRFDQRCHAVSGDVALANCGVEALPPFRYDQVWHSAASLKFEDRYAEEIFAINLQGTRHVLELAHAIGARHFNYISTAYVAGRHQGRILEAPIQGEPSQNMYEKSKLEAERLVEADRRFGKRIFRPSIVIGHSGNLAATNFTGMYGLLRKLFGFRGVMERAQADLLTQKSLAIKAEAEVSLNYVPIDCVVSSAVRIHADSSPSEGETQYYHLTNPVPPTVGDAISLMFTELGMQAPTFVDSTEGLEWLDEKFNTRIDFYRTYLAGEKHFDRTNTSRFVEPHTDPYEMPEETLRAHYQWYIRRLEAERQDLPSSR